MELKIMTINVRCDYNDPKNPWEVRLEGILKLIKKENPSLIGTQELLPHQYEELKKELADDYLSFGEPRKKLGDENNAIFYKKDLLKVSDVKTFWLSNTPDIVGTKYFYSSLPRIATYGVFKTKDNFKFIFLNTHLDHISKRSRRRGLNLIIRRLKKYGNMPLVIAGDFNTNIKNSDFKPLTSLNSLSHTYDDLENSLTFHNFSGKVEGLPIDYIFYSNKDFKLIKTFIIRDKHKNIYLSDHYPVISTLKVL